MCSTICENTVNGSTWGGCLEAAEDERQTTARDFSAHASKALDLLSKPTADPDYHIALLEHNSDAFGSSIANQTQDRLRQSIKRNFEGREYITKPTILQALSKDVVHCLVQPHISEWTHSEIAKQLSTDTIEDIVDYIDTEAKVLLALCIFIGVPMCAFLKLLEAGTRDSSLPLPGECPSGIEKASFVSILEMQWIFLPYDLFAHPGQTAVPREYVIPLLFDKEKDVIGCGAHSDVYQVTMDDGCCFSSMTCEKPSIYALKRFKDENPSVERSFGREYSVLQELVKVPHDHILLHLAAWSQGGVFYMIFPQARCNLRTFMGEVECPGLAAKSVIWFFKQLRGLADAVRHMHALKPLPALYQFRKNKPIADTNQAAFHNDIKPENILVFDSDDGSPGVLKISDFGCGKVSRKDCCSEAQITEGFYGTPEYESPDLIIYREASKPNDIWALGCVFLELLDWFMIPRTDRQMTFQSQRFTGPGPTNAAFWWRNAENKFQLKPQVGQKMMELENTYCLEKRAFELVLHMIWFLLATDMNDRWPAERVYNDLNHITRQAIVDLGQDPDYYLRPKNVPQTIPLLIAARPQVSWLADSDSEDSWHEEDGWYMGSKYYDWNTTYAEITDFEGNEHHLGNKETGQPVAATIAARQADLENAPPPRKKRDFWERPVYRKYAQVLNIKTA